MSVAINVEPWFHYPNDGGAPVLRVELKTQKTAATLLWSTRLGRFFNGWESMNFRRSNPGAYREAKEAMHAICSKVQQQGTVTLDPASVTLPAESVTEAHAESVTPRVRAEPLRAIVTVSRGLRDVTEERDTSSGSRDSDSPGPEGQSVTITSSAEVRKEEHRRRLMDPRFAGLVAGWEGSGKGGVS